MHFFLNLDIVSLFQFPERKRKLNLCLASPTLQLAGIEWKTYIFFTPKHITLQVTESLHSFKIFGLCLFLPEALF